MQSIGAESTAEQVLNGTDLRGKRFFITGTSAGLGVETARALAARGAQVVGAVRDAAKGQHATEVVRAHAAAGGGLELVQLDLASLDSVRSCANALLADGRRFDGLIANAGVMACPAGKTADGYETQFGVNYLGHFLLINRLVSLLRPAARVVMLSSSAHNFADVNLDDLNFEHTPYAAWVAYGSSKTSMALFAVEFDRRHRDGGIRAVAVHPGGIKTELTRHLTPQVMQELRSVITPDHAARLSEGRVKSIPQGAATTVWAAVVADASAVGGQYCEDCHIAAPATASDSGVRAYALDPDRARMLWTTSEQLVGEQF